MRYGLIVFAATMIMVFGPGAAAAPWTGVSALKATAGNSTPVEPAGCRANGRKCPIGTQEECKDGRCTCRPCAY